MFVSVSFPCVSFVQGWEGGEGFLYKYSRSPRGKYLADRYKCQKGGSVYTPGMETVRLAYEKEYTCINAFGSLGHRLGFRQVYILGQAAC